MRRLAVLALFTISCAASASDPDFYGTYETEWTVENAYCVEGLSISLGNVEIFDYGLEDDPYDLYLYFTDYEMVVPCHFSEDEPESGMVFECTYGLLTSTSVVALKIKAAVSGNLLFGELGLLVLNFAIAPSEDYKPFCVTEFTFSGTKLD